MVEYTAWDNREDDDGIDRAEEGLTSGCPMSLEASSRTEWTAGEAVVSLW